MGRRFSDQFDYAAMDFSRHTRPPRAPSPRQFHRAADAAGADGGTAGARRLQSLIPACERLRDVAACRAAGTACCSSTRRSRSTGSTTRSSHKRVLTSPLPEQCALLRPIMRSSSYPRQVRVAIGDMLLGQHRWAWRQSLKQRRYWLAAAPRSACAATRTVCATPRAIVSAHGVRAGARVRHRRLSLEPGPRRARPRRAKDVMAQGSGTGRESHSSDCGPCAPRAAAAGTRAPRRAARGGARDGAQSAEAAGPVARPTQIWIDGTSLGFAQTGYFNLISESIRRLAHHPSRNCLVHVTTQAAGRAALRQRLGNDVTAVRLHRAGWRSLHWRQIDELLFGWPVHLMVAVAAAGTARGGHRACAGSAPSARTRPAASSASAAAELLRSKRTFAVPRRRTCASAVSGAERSVDQTRGRARRRRPARRGPDQRQVELVGDLDRRARRRRARP